MALSKIQSESINLADNFAFTGTVSGAGGITGAEILYHTSQTTLSSSYTKLPDWSSHNGSQIGSIGSNLTNSSGDISFPSTGIWLIQSRITYYATGSTENRYCISQIRSSTDSGSNYTVIDESIDNLSSRKIYSVKEVNIIFKKLKSIIKVISNIDCVVYMEK